MPQRDSTDMNWPPLERTRQAVVVVDMVESVRLMQAHEDSVIARWRRLVRAVSAELLPAFGGRLIKSLGDGLLLSFDDTAAAAAATFALHRLAERLGAGEAGDEPIVLRCGLHVCEVLREHNDILGAGVNLAARLATLADPGCTVASQEARDEIVVGLDAEVVDLGLCYLKHLDEPVRAFRLGRRPAAVQAGPELAAPAAVEDLGPLLALLPFEQRGLPGSQHEHMLGDWIAEGGIVLLSKAPMLRLVSRLSTAAFRGRRASLGEIASHLGADYVLSGSYAVQGSRVQLTAELAATRSGEVLWSDMLPSSVDDLLAPSSQTLQQLAVEVQRAMHRAEAHRSSLQAPPNLESFSLQIGGITMMHRSSRQDFERANTLLSHLIERHPRIAAPRAWLALRYVLRVTRGWVNDPTVEAGIALDQVRRARDADPEHSLALTMKGFVECHMLKDLDKAQATLETAIALNSSDSLAWLFKGVVFSLRGQGEQALAMVEEAGRLSPLDPLGHYYDALSAPAALAANKLERAEAYALRSLKVNRLHSPTWRALVIAQSELGHLDRARASLQSLLALDPTLTVSSYLARSPAGANDTRKRYADALQRAGLPLH
jgi:adenylate cyclase